MISIIVPSYNEEKYIGGLIQSVLEQSYSINKIELLICDGLSEDGTAVIVEEFSKINSSVKLLRNPKKFTPHALNLGIQNSIGDYVMILGAHSELPTNYLEKAIEIFNRTPDCYCLGGLLINENENFDSEIIELAMSSPFGVGNAYFRTGIKFGKVDTVAFGLYKKEVFEKVGFFNEVLVRNQDDEFNFRLEKSGLNMYLSPELSIKYFVRGSFSKLSKQYYQYGIWKVYVNKLHSTITTIRQLIPAILVKSLSILLFLSIIDSRFIFLFGLEVIFYLVTAFYFASKKTKEVKIKFHLIKCFLILHISYGYGYLQGIWKFLILRKNPSDNLTKTSR